MTMTAPVRAGERAIVRPLAEADLAAADRVLRSAFETFVGVPNLFGDADYVHTRFQAAPDAALMAELEGELVGSNFLTRWGSFGFFGPLSVRPDLWDQGVAGRLLDPTVELLDRWGVSDAGLFTFANSPKHVALYARYRFWPQSLTFVGAAPVPKAPVAPRYDLFSAASPSEKQALLEGAAEITASLLDGLDVRREIEAVDVQRLGDTLLLVEDDLAGFAVCHTGPGTEAGSDACYVKFAAVRTGRSSAATFERLLDCCFNYAACRRAAVVIAGSNAARVGASQALFSRGFQTQLQGVAMQRDNQSGFNRPDVFAIDDWR